MNFRIFYLTSVWILIIFQFITYISLFLNALAHKNTLLFFIIMPIFITISSLCMYTYYLSIITSPGSPQHNINDYYQNLQNIKMKAKQQQIIKKKIRGQKAKKKSKNQDEDFNPLFNFDQIQSLIQVSFCFKCQRIKEPRVHHCKICGKCYQRMDHHCPFIGNCVGKYNHKYFVLFLFYATIGTGMIFVSILLDLLDENPIVIYYDFMGKLFIVINGIIGIILCILIGTLFIGQMYVLKDNLTTLQNNIQDIKKKNPFNKNSFIENMNQIFGNSNWLLPTDPFKYASITQNQIQ